ncbi:aspartate/glutamate racemase family protein [Anaerococcus sp. mt242]|uniref:aspartate/glutamate racemase family protein n=1 Tax=Anaerococcus sp. mt242 TaxID=2661917 RepID=UPI001933229C|nr:amino acid racemase [Anaerococcus sp. mt242]MBM0046780.1 aspartate/glutamate racemase family protein [Anaerococcus sp. mt242]
MKKLGILGGMGPLCTANFYQKIVQNTKADKDQGHIPTIIISDPQIPDRTAAILTGKDEEILLKKFKEDLENLENQGVDNIAIPCNTMHYYYDTFKNYTKVNIINMVEETLLYCKKNNDINIAVLGTKATMSCGIYEKYAGDIGINIIPMNDKIKDFTMDTIYKIKETNETNHPEFLDMIKYLKNTGVDAIILACTELSLIDNITSYDFVIDAMDILTYESIKKSDFELKL